MFHIHEVFVLDKAELEQASSFLEQAAAANLPEFIKTLSDILRHGGNSLVARMAAGLQLKNQLTSKDPNIKLTYQRRWLAFPEEIRTYVKKNVSTPCLISCYEYVLINKRFQLSCNLNSLDFYQKQFYAFMKQDHHTDNRSKS